MTVEESIEVAVQRALDRHLAAIRESLARLEQSQPPKMMTIAEAAASLGCHPNTVRRMIKTGQLSYRRIGGRGSGVRIDAKSLHGAGWER
jgi:excisionase family DNA binding protein